MTKAVAMKFIEYFCAGDIDQLDMLLSPEFELLGPLYQFDNAEDYIMALRQDPPAKGEFRITSVTESDSQVAIFYDYVKGGSTLSIAQLFMFDEQNKIKFIKLIFDKRDME